MKNAGPDLVRILLEAHYWRCGISDPIDHEGVITKGGISKACSNLGMHAQEHNSFKPCLLPSHQISNSSQFTIHLFRNSLESLWE